MPEDNVQGKVVSPPDESSGATGGYNRASPDTNRGLAEHGVISQCRFNKIPHPVERLLRQLLSVDGLEVRQLLKFLAQVLKIRTIFSLPDAQLLETIYPYCKGPLGTRVRDALLAGHNFDNFHSDLILFFIPRRMFDSLRQELFGRLQREDETLAEYVESIKDAAAVLKLSLSEVEVVANITDGLGSSQRCRLVFEKAPRTYGDLDQLCVHDNNIRFSDNVRMQEVRRNQMLTAETNYVSPKVNMVVPNVTAGNHRRQDKRCFYCNKVGHVRRDCRQRLREVSSTESRGRNNNRQAK
jgi:hypothetical protein